MPRALGFATVSVLRAIHAGRRYGLDIMDGTGLGGGTVYKLLHRLEQRGMVRGVWEPAEIAEKERRPRRRYYELTDDGEAGLAEALVKLRALTRGTEGPTGPRDAIAREG